MSHLVQIQTEVRDGVAVGLACGRLGWREAVFGRAVLYSGARIGWIVTLPGWRYPIVADVATGQIHFDNFEGRWGDRQQLDRFLQAYAVEKVKLESRKQGHLAVEQPLADGSVKVTVYVEGHAA